MPNNMVTVDVIVPLRNEERYLPRLLQQIQNQDYPLNKIILVVAPSEDKTLQIAEKAAIIDSRVSVLTNPRLIAPAAMNIGLAASTAEAWIRLDGHTEIPSDLVSTLVDELQAKPVAAVGPTLVSGAFTKTQEAIGTAITSPFCVGNARFRTGAGGAGPTDTVAFGLYRTADTRPIGGYNETLPRTEDDEFNTRLRRSGKTIWLTNRVSVTYFPRTRLMDLFKQRASSGYWRVVSTYEYNNEIRFRQLPPSILTAATFAAIVKALTGTSKPLGILAASYAAFLSVHAWWAKRNGAPCGAAVMSIPAVAVIHYAYGTGYLAGIGAHILRRAYGRFQSVRKTFPDARSITRANKDGTCDEHL